MEYLHIKNLEAYHPGYKDRDLKWFKCYFKMVNADPEFEMLCEIDKWRFVAFIMLELQYQKPIPLDEKYLKRKGFDFRKRSISLTIQMLHNSIEVVTGDPKPCSNPVTQSKNREEEEKKKMRGCIEFFDIFRKLYPGKKTGLEPEWKNFTKKHSNWRDILPLLKPALEAQIASRESLLKAKEFVPAWKHLKTWINNQCWTEEPAQRTSTARPRDKCQFPGCGSEEVSTTHNSRFYCPKHLKEVRGW